MKGGALRTRRTATPRHVVTAIAAVTMVALPLLLLEGPKPVTASGAEKAASATQLRGERHLRRLMLVGNRVPAPTTTTTTTTAPPPPAAPLSAPAQAAAPSPATHIPVAPQYRPAPPTTTTRPLESAAGIATWYAWVPGQCASPTLPKGTRVTVRNVATGATATCLVTDREAANPGRVIDLDTSVFAQLAPLSSGTISVVVSW